MEPLIDIYKRLLNEVFPLYHRTYYDTFHMDHRCIGVVGARGVGKTTFLLQFLRQQYENSDKGLYISADNLYFADHTLIETVDKFVKYYGGELICIDEIHRYKNWNQELKNIYDSYPSLKILFSGSSSIDLIKGKYDLSRRVLLRPLFGFSFREYLEIQTGKSYPILDIDTIVRNDMKSNIKLETVPKILGHLHQYWENGYYPTSRSIETYTAFQETLLNIIDKTVYEDISAFYALKTENIDSLKKIIYFYATSEPGTMNINKLAKSLQKDHATITQYVQILRDTGLLRFLLINKTGHALVRNAEKIYLDNTNLLYAINAGIGKEIHIGTVRELFTIQSIEQAAYRVFYSRDGDICVNNYTFEIGGLSKERTQLKNIENSFVIKDDIVHGSGRSIPLYLFGFLR
ncbi:AAA family ATPase [Candidatus Roizmanbacteria bacterium]|nr:AAA family ATPase [Candidatus Roizmanbacteria bacterium]